ncbi:hypothetical protein F4824DRAFT_232198 [Ustulina deusta]|nr:hypothetical protein F4824DRAFT_232198 [Ustulina deusta]
MTDNRNVWRQQDPIPSACELCENKQEEREYDLALTNPNRCFGRGIKEDPLVVWIDRTQYRKRDVVWGHNNFAKAIAKMLGLTHTWIIKAAQDRQYARDAEGSTIPKPDTGTKDPGLAPDRLLLEETDMHIELRLGTGLYDCRLSAHVYVMLDKSGNPERYMTKRARTFKRKGEDRQLTFWRWQNCRKRLRSRRPISLGRNWEVYANVGPYLDTYRPYNRGTRNTCTPPNDTTPPREYLENDDDIFQGAMTDELRGMVRKCHAAYDVYEASHKQLAPMQNPGLESVRELHVMREHIVTMKREIYREAKGLLV